MKIAVSLPDDLYLGAERLVKALGISRSRLYADAVREYLAHHDPDEITEILNKVYELDPASDPAIRAAAAEVFRRTEWQ
jgi:metal-responsive CopG/Arc/MetJ family transcriptional regulator